jgi:hypothetical protein
MVSTVLRYTTFYNAFRKALKEPRIYYKKTLQVCPVSQVGASQCWTY